MLESFIASTTIAIVGVVVAYALRRIERQSDAAAAVQEKTWDQFRRDLDAIAGALRMHRGHDGNLYRNPPRRRSD